MSFLNFPRHYAVFFDDKGEYVGRKLFSWSFGARGLTKKTFDFNGGSYNILPQKSSQINFNFKSRLIFSDFIYVYNINLPDPISFKGREFTPIMTPEVYKTRLKSKLVDDLNKAGLGKFEINWKWVIIGIVVIGVIIFFASGGDTSALTGGA